jgi:hypothetical protein
MLEASLYQAGIDHGAWSSCRGSLCARYGRFRLELAVGDEAAE